jgi:hypothetical protein
VLVSERLMRRIYLTMTEEDTSCTGRRNRKKREGSKSKRESLYGQTEFRRFAAI